MVGGLTTTRLGGFDVQCRRLARFGAEVTAQESDHFGGAQVAVNIDHNQGPDAKLDFKRRLMKHKLSINGLVLDSAANRYRLSYPD